MELRGEVHGQGLSPREWDVLRAVALFGGQKEAARELGIAYQTLKNHISHVYHKLGVTTQSEALVAVGWLHLPSPAETVVHNDEVALAHLRAERERLRAEAQDIADGLAE